MNDTNAKETPESGLKPEPDDALKNRPIGVFDSGMGGLTVLHELIQSLPDERFIYLGDTARVPYGSRSPETIRRYSMEVASYLVKQQIKYLVIACNTSTAHAEALLKEKMSVPVLGVIRPGVEALLAAASEAGATVGVLGTRSTVKSGAYERLIKERRDDLNVVSQACPLFVPLVEEGWTDNAVTEEVIRQYVDGLVNKGMSAAVLGCTHYPLLKKAFARVYPQLQLVDSSVEVARTVAAELDRLQLRRAPQANGRSKVRILLTDVTEHVAFLEKLFLGIELGIEEVPIDELKS